MEQELVEGKLGCIMQHSSFLKGENKMRHRKSEYRKRWLAKKKKLNDDMANLNRVQFQIDRILRDTGISVYALARVLQVSKYAVSNWKKGLALPHKQNRERIERVFNQRMKTLDGEDYVILTDEQKDLINNPKPLRKHVPRKKRSKAESSSVLDRLTTGFLKKLWG